MKIKNKINLFHFFACIFSFSIHCVYAQNMTTVVQDDFTNTSKFIDLSLLTQWGTNPGPVSAFGLVNKTDNEGLSYRAITLTDTSRKYSMAGTAYNNPMGLKTLTCFDYKFNTVSRNYDTLKVEFDALWDSIPKAAYGQNERLLLALMHEYPQTQPLFGDVDSTNKLNPFGRPAYHMRLMPTASSLGAMMNYGGGPKSKEGEFEQYNNAGSNWWLPGFISSNQAGKAPGDESPDAYPYNPTMKTGGNVVSSTQWRHFTWLVQPNRLVLYSRPSKQTAASDQVVFFMETPRNAVDPNDTLAMIQQLNDAHGLNANPITKLPALYNWFDKLVALRVYLRGGTVHVANLEVSRTSNFLSISRQQPTTNAAVKIYPNPATNVLNIKVLANDASTIHTIIYDQMGKCVLDQSYGKVLSGTLLQENIANIPAGIYYLKTYINDQPCTPQVFIKQ